MNTTNNRQILGDFAEIRFTNLPASAFIRGKVDTGATICSLHADNYTVNKDTNMITFKCPHISENNITLPLVDRQATKTADNGTEYRPVIEMSVKIDDVVMNNVKFNLNDRSNMDCPVLIGQNLIKAGKFLIDPTKMDEAVDLEKSEDNVENVDDSVSRLEIIDNIYQAMRNSDVSLGELLRYGEKYNERNSTVAVQSKTEDSVKQDLRGTDGN